MDLDLILRDRRAMAAAGAGAVVLLAVLGIALGLTLRGHGHPAKPPEAEVPHSLKVELGHEDPGLDPQRPLRCFVGGQFVGMVTLKECAKKNGVQANSLDLGLDPSGELAAAAGDASVLQPLPGAPAPPAAAAPSAPEPAAGGEAAPTAAKGPNAACWRFVGPDWRKVSEDMSLDGCVQALFAGRCEKPGAADYGRWGADTLRLVVGKVERSGDNRSFRTLVRQPPGDCIIPHLTE
jgi:hypothetical protein